VWVGFFKSRHSGTGNDIAKIQKEISGDRHIVLYSGGTFLYISPDMDGHIVLYSGGTFLYIYPDIYLLPVRNSLPRKLFGVI
jgi:hypothetical protein